MAQINRIDITDQGVQKALDRVIKAGSDPKPILQDIGEYMVSATKGRFDDSTGPDGERWASNSQATILTYLSRFRSSFSRKTGKISQAGANRAIAKKPLIGETNSLSTQIYWQIDGQGTLEVGSPMEYAAAQQFGMKKGQAGTSKRGSPIPWGDIPARAFLGVSDSDSRSILDIIEEHYSQR